MLLDEKEKKFIHTCLTLAIFCPARHYSNKLCCGRSTAEELLDMQIFLGQISEHCNEIWMFRRLDEDYREKTAGSQPARLPDPDPDLADPQPKPIKLNFNWFTIWYKNIKFQLHRRAGHRAGRKEQKP